MKVCNDTAHVAGCPLGVSDCPLAAEVDRLRVELRRLEAENRFDALTGCFNFRHLMTLLGGEMERTRRSGLPTALIMIDIDHFKRINDTWGHETGNQALRWVAGRLKEGIRRIDFIGRYGGEEFVVVLPGTRAALAVRTAERLRRTLAGAALTVAGGDIRLTASFGVAAYEGPCRPGPDLTAAEFIDRADRLLLEAKRSGRNRVHYDRQRLAGTGGSGLCEAERAALSFRS